MHGTGHSHDVLTRRALLGLAAATAAAVALPARARGSSLVLRLGDQGGAVLALNRRLAELTYLPRPAPEERFGEATFHAVVAFQKQRGLRRDGVVGARTRAALHAAVAPSPPVRAGERGIQVLLRRQLAFLVEDGSVLRTVAVSTGAPGYETPRGRFAVYRRERRSWSVPYRVWMPWAAYFAHGIAFHAYPEVPPYPASHGCIRVPPPLARELYEFARPGTEVVVVP